MRDGERDCVLYACFLPSVERWFVVEEQLSVLRERVPQARILVGVQHGSVPGTEALLAEHGAGLRLRTRRVHPEMAVDSDASAFLAALSLLAEEPAPPERCFFIHTKGVTSDEHETRQQLMVDLFDPAAVDAAFARRGIGCYGPLLSLMPDPASRRLMPTACRFLPAADVVAPAFAYFFVATFFVVRGDLVTRFLERASPELFTTPVQSYSDRYFFERDFVHLVEMTAGLRPAFLRLAGNHFTAYVRPRRREYVAALAAWWVRCRLRLGVRTARRLARG